MGPRQPKRGEFEHLDWVLGEVLVDHAMLPIESLDDEDWVVVLAKKARGENASAEPRRTDHDDD